MKTITVQVEDVHYDLLATLIGGRCETVDAVVLELIDHAQQGVYRPGAWERHWLIQVFGDDFVKNLEAGCPYGIPNCEDIFQRPKEKALSE